MATRIMIGGKQFSLVSRHRTKVMAKMAAKKYRREGAKVRIRQKTYGTKKYHEVFVRFAA